MSIPSDGGGTRVATAPPPPPPPPPPPKPEATKVQHTLAKNESIDQIAHRYQLPQDQLLAANPQVRNPDRVQAGQTLTIPIGPTAGKLPATHELQKGESLQDVARQYHVGEDALKVANGITRGDSVYPGDTVWVPGAGEPAARPLTAAGPELVANPTPTPQAQKVDDALRQVQSAQSALDYAKAHVSNGAVRADLRSGDFQRALSDANAKLKTAVADEITAQAGAPGPIDQKPVNQAGDAIVARYASNPAAQSTLQATVADVKLDRTTTAALAPAKGERDPQKALTAFNDAYTKASPEVQQRLLASTDGQAILKAAADKATEPLTSLGTKDEPYTPPAANQALTNLNNTAAPLDRTVAAAYASYGVGNIDQYNRAYNAANGQNAVGYGAPAVTGPETLHAVMSLSGKIAGTPQGDAAVSTLAQMQFWNLNVGSEIASGTSVAYPAEVARQLKAAGQDPTSIFQTIQEGVQSNQATVQGDVDALADHNKELNWLINNDGKLMTTDQLQKAITDYQNKDGDKWKTENDRLTQKLEDDGALLADNLATLDQLGNENPDAAKQLGIQNTVASAFNDDKSAYAMSLAAGRDPTLLTDGKGQTLVNDVLNGVKLTDTGRKALQEIGSNYVRNQFSSALQGLDLSKPADIAKAQSALDALKEPKYSKLLGVDNGVWQKGIDTLKSNFPTRADSLEDLTKKYTAINDALDGQGLKAFDKTTVAGSVLRSVGVVAGVASLYGSGAKLADAMRDQNSQATAFYGVQTLVNAAGLTQKVAELGVNTGVISGPSNETAAKVFGDFAGKTGQKVFGVAGAAFDLVDGIRSQFGVLGAKPDGVDAGLKYASAAGGALVAASLFTDSAAGAVAGPVGIGIVAVATIGKVVYDQVKAASQYEGASTDFIKASGAFNGNAAGALGQQDGIFSGASGAAVAPFLAKYAALKGLSPQQTQSWVNSLSADQVSNLGKRLQQSSGDAGGNVDHFTNGPAQTTYIAGGGGFAVPITLTNTVGEFEKGLAYDHVPLP